MQIKNDISYGVIPIKRVNDSWEVFLINQFSKIGKNTYWILPKGHPENNETPKQTAIRELKEETNMSPSILLDEPTFKLQYDFVFDQVKINKTVVFFIGVIEDGEYEVDGEEVKEAGWYSLSAATERLDYRDTKEMFSQAREFIENYQ